MSSRRDFEARFEHGRRRGTLVTSSTLGALVLLVVAGRVRPELAVPTSAVVALALVVTAAALAHRMLNERAYDAVDRVEAFVVSAALAGSLVAGSPWSPLWVAWIALVYWRARVDEPSLTKTVTLVGPVIAALGLFVVRGSLQDAAFGLLVALPAVYGYLMLVMAQRRLSNTRKARADARADVAAKRVSAERVRIARELHDGVGAELHALIWTAQSLEETAEVRAIVDRIQRSISELRGAVNGLRDTAVPWRGLVNDIRARVQAVFADAEVAVVDESPDVVVDVPAEFAHQLLRVVQEAVTNAVRHAKPKHVTVALSAANGWRAVIRDDGRGFDPSGLSRKSGLVNLAARAQTWGGELTIESDPTGTCISVRFPRERVRSLGEITTLLR